MHRAVIETQKRPKIGSKRGERRRQLTTLSAAVIVTTSSDGTKRVAFFVFFCVFQSSTNSA
jgi:hypothetical protein